MSRVVAIVVLIGGAFLASSPSRAETITINDVSAAPGGTVQVPVLISGGGNVANVSLAFSVGDGGPALPPGTGTETITITSVDYYTDTIWSVYGVPGHQPENPTLPVASATVTNVFLNTAGQNVAASGRLMTFTLDLATATVGEHLKLDPDALGLSGASDAGGTPLTLSFVPGYLNIVPEPSAIVMLLGFGSVGLWACFRRRVARRPG